MLPTHRPRLSEWEHGACQPCHGAVGTYERCSFGLLLPKAAKPWRAGFATRAPSQEPVL
jgi:hypothetical protein